MLNKWLLFLLVSPGVLCAQITIRGDVPETVIQLSDLASMPRETMTVTEEDGAKIAYEGVPLRELLKKAGVPVDGKQLRGKALASYIIAKAHDGYQVVFSIGEIGTDFGNESILVADKRDGKPLFAYQGPVRLVIPNDKAGARSVRMLEVLEYVRLQK